VALIYSPVVVAAAIYLPAVVLIELEPVKIFVTQIGYIPPTPPAIIPMESRTNELATTWAVILGLTMTLWLVLSYMVTRSWYVQSANDAENKVLEQDTP